MKNHARRRGVYVPSAQTLENAALFYLGRYAASEFSLRRVLENRLRRAAMQNAIFAEDDAAQARLRAAIDAIVDRHKKTGALNDDAYADMKTSGWRRAGRSARAIRQRLGNNGVASGIIERALKQGGDDENSEDPEFKAAIILAKRRKLGPFRKGENGPDQKRKDFATLARAGFSFAIARQVLAAEADV